MAFAGKSGEAAVAIAAALFVGGCSSGARSDADAAFNEKPAFLVSVTRTAYDGASDDLLTAGLGKTGLAAAAPTYANPAAPTAAELRRAAIWGNYRAIVDVAANGGFGTLYGPNVDRNGQPTLGEGKVAGVEYLAYADDGSGRKNVALMVQVPATWDRARPCVVTGTSSGSRGVYGAIGSAGEWGLKRGCAVAYADKGSGMGVHDLATDTVNLRDGTRASAAAAGTGSSFTSLEGNALADFNAANPNRIAVKHAHSQQNPEKDWGADTLNAVRFALWALSEEKGDRNADGSVRRAYRADNTLVIASSVSNGAGAAIAAAELDSEGLIDGVAVSEPNVALAPAPGLVVRRGANSLAGAGRPLYDYFTYANLLQPCASLSTRAAGSPGAAFVPAAVATNRCTSLRNKGVLAKPTTAELAEEAMDLLIAYGWEAETAKLHASHYAFATASIATTYANTYSRASVADSLCGLSFAFTDANGRPAPMPAASLAQVFATGNGIPPMAGINIVNNLHPGGPLRDAASTSPTTGLMDFNLDGAMCQRALWTGTDAGAARLKAGVDETRRSGNLRGKPAIIVHGRADTLVPPAFTSRPYYGQNRIVEGSGSKLTYVEVTHAQHFDTFIDNAALPGYDSLFVPLHYYFNQAMDLVYAHLTAGAPLPPSQVVRTTPRGGTPGSAPAITRANVPSISATPASADRITFSGTTVSIPD
jgi:hydroxybutyrate-dimer hydrolase